MISNDPYAEQLGSYSSIEAGISTRIPTKYCDFFCFHAMYTDPKSKLRYFSQEQYALSRLIAKKTEDELLAVRKANIVLK